jgi:hypothetical protein
MVWERTTDKDLLIEIDLPEDGLVRIIIEGMEIFIPVAVFKGILEKTK